MKISSSSSSSGLEQNFYHLVSPISKRKISQMADLYKWYISFNSKLWIGIPWNFLWIDKDVEIGQHVMSRIEKKIEPSSIRLSWKD